MVERRGVGVLTPITVEDVIRQVEDSVELMEKHDVSPDKLNPVKTSIEVMRNTSPEKIIATLDGAQEIYEQLKRSHADSETIATAIKEEFPDIVHLLPFLRRRRNDGLRLAFLLAEEKPSQPLEMSKVN